MVRVCLRSECPLPCPADQDGDKQLSLPEFISLPVGTVENQQGQDIDDSWVRDRKKEFEELIDANHDGIVTMAELEVSAGAWGGVPPTPTPYLRSGPGPRLPGAPEARGCGGKAVAGRRVTSWHLEVGSLCAGKGDSPDSVVTCGTQPR